MDAVQAEADPEVTGVELEDDPVVLQLQQDLRELQPALDLLTHHGHRLAAGFIAKEMRNTSQLIGKWRAVHNARLPL